MRGRLIGHRIKYWRKDLNETTESQYLLSRSQKPRALIIGLQPNAYYWVITRFRSSSQIFLMLEQNLFGRLVSFLCHSQYLCIRFGLWRIIRLALGQNLKDSWRELLSYGHKSHLLLFR